jgi:tetratricopeptide (TPR) repeat protein
VIAARLAGRIHRDRGRFEEADALFEESLAAAAGMEDGDLAERASTEIEYAKSLAAQGRRNAARARLESYLAELDLAGDEEAGQRGRVESALGAL